MAAGFSVHNKPTHSTMGYRSMDNKTLKIGYVVGVLSMIVSLETYAAVIPVKTNSDLSSANNSAKAGDIVEIYGGTYSVPISPSNSGSSGSPIRYQNRDGEVVNIRTFGAYDLDVNGKNYIEVRCSSVGSSKGINFGGSSDSKLGGNLRLTNGVTHFVMDNCAHMYSVPNNTGVTVEGNAGSRAWTQDIVFTNNYFERHGLWNSQTFSDPKDGGNGFVITGSDGDFVRRVLVEGNEFVRYGGHTPILIKAGREIIIMNNTMNDDWRGLIDGSSKEAQLGGTAGSKYFVSSSGGNDKYQGGEGQRNFAYQSRELSKADTYRHSLFQGNFSSFSGIPSDVQGDKNANKNGAGNSIFRFNVFYNGKAQCCGIFIADFEVHNHYFYNNSIVRIANSGFQFGASRSTLGFSNLNFINNLLHKISYAPTASDKKVNLAYLGFQNKISTGNEVMDSNVQYNMLDSNAKIYIDGASSVLNTLSERESAYPRNIKNNLSGSPVFKGGSVDSLTKKSDFELKSGSAGIDKGSHLTLVTSSGSGSKFTVADAGYLFDGWGVYNQNGQPLKGDPIMVGPSKIKATIIDIDYATNEVTVDKSVSVSDGDKVWYAFNGNGPDIGAIESGATAYPPSPPSNVGAREVK